MMKDTPLSERILRRWKNRKYIAYFLVIAAAAAAIAGFTDSISKIFGFASAIISDNATPVIIPNDTGWILAGYYDEHSQMFIQGPYIKVVRSSYRDKQPLPRIGEWIRIRSERNIVILDFATKGLTRTFVPPWQQTEGKLLDGDYTGWKLPKGAMVEVRDVSRGSFPGKVKCRLGTSRSGPMIRMPCVDLDSS
jgi:hypothetical protein